ncbi:MAG: hypothetical protein A2W11_04650 [Ignavibacteria bacterium RBG_16_35_7]|nr:MAG: hypothetical protein A2W11_04650 [Ignavibacteria bacterium RBG_16_35_7]
MCTIKLYLLIIAAVCMLAATAEAQLPQINSISADTLTRSGRLRIFGNNFGSGGGSSQVVIDGYSAIITRWSVSQITAYVPELAGPGSVGVQVVTSGGASNTLSLNVTLRQQQGRVRWAFEADVTDLWWRPALATDGTIYVHGSEGFVFALSPNGGLKWATKVNWYAYVPPAVGLDGTIYVGSIQRITALNPDGTQRWQFNDAGTQGVHSGPAIGQDGNIYFANDFGLGAYSLSPGGQLRWNNLGTPPISWYGGIGGETVLGPLAGGGVIDQMYVVPEPFLEDYSLQAFSLTDGSLRFSVIIEGQDDPFGQQQTQPAVGPDGTVYVTHMRAFGGIGWVLEAYSPLDGHSLWYYHDNGPNNGMTPPDVGPDGIVYYSASTSCIIAFNPSTLTQNWQYQDGTIMYHPTVSPLNDMVVTGGVVTFGDVGFIKAISTGSGQLLWNVPLPGAFYPEPRVVPVHHPRFTLDGNTVYVSTTILGGSETDPHSFLYAIATGADSTINVELVSFNASVVNKDVTLNWKTATEINNAGFEIQRKRYEGVNINTGWNAIGFVEGNGTTTAQSDYAFFDGDITAGKYYYRLKQVDYDGSYEYSAVVEVEVNGLPYQFSLEQNYPNPFNPTTTFEFQIANSGFVNLKIFDILGNEVETLVNEEKEPGSYKIKYDANHLASGVYYYKLAANGFTDTKKFILLK